MSIYFSPSELGYYHSSIHGEREVLALDQAAAPVMMQVPDPDNEGQTIEAPAPEEQQPHVWVPNPACKIPADAVEITVEHHAFLLANASQRMQLRADANGYPVLVDVLATDPQQLLVTLLNRIDHAADQARAAVAGDPLRAVEYDRARLAAEQFAAAGYQGDVPPMVAAWAINGRTPQQAADSILAEAEAYTNALELLRTTRLAAKEQVRALMAAGETEQAQQHTEQTIAAIEAAVAGIGNNAG